jgi:glycine cleavage system H protein
MVPGMMVHPDFTAQRSREFQQGQVWVQAHEGAYTLGLTHLGTEGLGELQSVTLPPEGAKFPEGEVLVELEGAEGHLEILAPFELEVQAVNESAEKDLERVVEDPLEEGWLVKFRIRPITKNSESTH